MATLERTYTIPIRREAVKTQRYKRTPKAVRVVKQFLVKHMKSENVLIGPALNQKLWSRGMQSPPPRVKVNCVRDEEGVVRAELFGAPAFLPPVKEEDKKGKKKDAKKEEKKDEKPKVTDLDAKKDVKPAAKPEAKKEESKPASTQPAPKSEPKKDAAEKK